jgi:hypothetical protein
MNKCIFLILLNLLVATATFAQEIKWVASGIGSDFTSDNEYITNATTIVQGNGRLYVSGVLIGPTGTIGDTTISNFDSSGLSYIIAQYDLDGKFIKTVKNLGSGNAIFTIDNVGNIYYALRPGFFQHFSILKKFDIAGNLLWDKTYPDKFIITASCVDKNNDLIVAGEFDFLSSSVTLEGISIDVAEGHHIFMIKYGSDGVAKWIKTSNATTNGSRPASVSVRSIDVDDSNSIYMIGDFLNGAADSVLLGDIALKAKTKVIQGFERVQKDVMIAKMDPDGEFLWARSFGGPKDDWGNKIKVGKNADLFFTGSFRDSIRVDDLNYASFGLSQFFIGKISVDNQIRWIEVGHENWAFNESQGLNTGRALSVGDDGVYVGGSYVAKTKLGSGADTATVSSNYSFQSAFIAKYKLEGGVEWVMGGSDGESGIYDLDYNHGNLYFSGYFGFSNTVSSSPKLAGHSLPLLTHNSVFLIYHFMAGVIDPSFVTMVDHDDISDFELFPNPVEDILNLRFLGNSRPGKSAKIIDSMGRIVFAGKVDTRENAEFDVQHLKSGLYTVIVQHGNRQQVKKIFKQ